MHFDKGLRASLLALLILALPSAVFAGGGPGVAGEPAEQVLGTRYEVGPAQVTDELNQLTFELPEGWTAIVPLRGLSGTTTIANYDQGTIENHLPEHSSHVLLKEMAKIDLAVYDRGSQDLDAWVSDLQRRPSASSRRAPVSSRVLPLDLAGRSSRAFVVRHGSDEAMVLALPWKKNQVLAAVMRPADSADLETALRTLDGLRVPGTRPALAFRKARSSVAERASALRELLDDGSLVAERSSHPCAYWSGSDSGWYAGNTPITINLPFYWQTWWQAGGVGNFWGNYYHGNCYDDYYAIDFNRTSGTAGCYSGGSPSYLSDSGQNVYAAAGGTAYPYTGNPTEGYGKYVDVYHSDNVRTRYAHLSDVNVSWGQTVTNQSVVGWVGNTGNSGGPHLHFGFYQYGYSRCNKSGGCPNGESAEANQSPKPSPIWTNAGSSTISDFSCYQAPP